jgi:hypothetical protein
MKNGARKKSNNQTNGTATTTHCQFVCSQLPNRERVFTVA